MYSFILNQWVMRKYTDTQVQNCVVKKYITQEQANVIMSIPQIIQN